MKKAAIAALLLASAQSQAACHIASNLEGVAALSLSGFEINDDRVSGSFQLFIEGENASITPSDLFCRALTETLVMCVGGGEYAVLESWALYPSAGKILYTQTRTDFPIAELNGSKLFVGSLTTCQ